MKVVFVLGGPCSGVSSVLGILSHVDGITPIDVDNFLKNLQSGSSLCVDDGEMRSLRRGCMPIMSVSKQMVPLVRDCCEVGRDTVIGGVPQDDTHQRLVRTVITNAVRPRIYVVLLECASEISQARSVARSSNGATAFEQWKDARHSHRRTWAEHAIVPSLEFLREHHDATVIQVDASRSIHSVAEDVVTPIFGDEVWGQVAPRAMRDSARMTAH